MRVVPSLQVVTGEDWGLRRSPGKPGGPTRKGTPLSLTPQSISRHSPRSWVIPPRRLVATLASPPARRCDNPHRPRDDRDDPRRRPGFDARRRERTAELPAGPSPRITTRPARTLRIELDGDAVVATSIHRFWKAGVGWVMARELKPGDVVGTIDGTARQGRL